MATYHVGDSSVGINPDYVRDSRPRRKSARISSLSSYISERLEILRLPAGSTELSRRKKKNDKRRRSRAGCLRQCFLLRCFEFLGSPSGDFDNEADDVEYGPVRYVPRRLSTLIRTTTFTKEELKTMYRTFKNECPTGVVYEDTFKSIYAQFFPSGDTNMYAHYLFNAFDDNQEGFICFEEFVTSLSSLLRGKFEEKLQWIFKLYDINHDGFITRDEMRDIVKSVYSLLGPPTEGGATHFSCVEHANRVFQKLDQNNDGYVTYPEFVEVCSRDPTVIASLKIFDADF